MCMHVCTHVVVTAAHSFEWTVVPSRHGKVIPDPLKTWCTETHGDSDLHTNRPMQRVSAKEHNIPVQVRRCDYACNPDLHTREPRPRAHTNARPLFWDCIWLGVAWKQIIQADAEVAWTQLPRQNLTCAASARIWTKTVLSKIRTPITAGVLNCVCAAASSCIGCCVQLRANALGVSSWHHPTLCMGTAPTDRPQEHPLCLT